MGVKIRNLGYLGSFRRVKISVFHYCDGPWLSVSAAFSPSRLSVVVVVVFEPDDLDRTPTLADFEAAQLADPASTLARTVQPPSPVAAGVHVVIAAGDTLYHQSKMSSVL